MDGRIVIDVKLMDNLRRRFAFRVWPQTTVGEFKLMIGALLNIPVDQQILVHVDRRLQDDQTIGSYGLQDGHAVYLFRRSTPLMPAVSSGGAALAPVGGTSTPGSGSVQSLGSGSGNSASLSPGLDGGPEEILINVQYSSTRFAIRVRPELTIREMKGLITQQQNIPVSEQRLIYGGQFLHDRETIGSYGLQDGFVVHLARRSAPAAAGSAIELYASQLTRLWRMGFPNTNENIQALLATSGNVQAAVDRLLRIRFREGRI